MQDRKKGATMWEKRAHQAWGGEQRPCSFSRSTALFKHFKYMPLTSLLAAFWQRVSVLETCRCPGAHGGGGRLGRQGRAGWGGLGGRQFKVLDGQKCGCDKQRRSAGRVAGESFAWTGGIARAGSL